MLPPDQASSRKRKIATPPRPHNASDAAALPAAASCTQHHLSTGTTGGNQASKRSRRTIEGTYHDSQASQVPLRDSFGDVGGSAGHRVKGRHSVAEAAAVEAGLDDKASWSSRPANNGTGCWADHVHDLSCQLGKLRVRSENCVAALRSIAQVKCRQILRC